MTKERGSGTPFTHRPFAGLKGIKTSAPNIQKKKDSLQTETEEEAQRLFLTAVGGARPDNSIATKTMPSKNISENTDIDDKDKKMFIEAISAKSWDVIPKQEEQDDNRPSTSSRMRRLKKGNIRPSEELDLHGLAKDEAIARLSMFLASAYARGREAVLVITGKGNNSPDGPVLRSAVAKWLAREGQKLAVEFHTAPRELGGSGAYIVFLRAASCSRK